MNENYFAAEPAIIDRLTEAVPALKKVGGWADLDTALESAPATPAALVIYLGDRVPESGPSGALIEQRWCVALVVRVPAAQTAANLARDEAGQLIAQIMKALHGFAPAPRHTELELSGGVQARFYKGGTAVFGITFSVRRPLLVR